MDSKWHLESLNINYNNWGEYDGKHTGKVSFKNEGSDSFTFALNAEKTQKFIDLLAGMLFSSSAELSKKLMESIEEVEDLPPKEEEE